MIYGDENDGDIIIIVYYVAEECWSCRGGGGVSHAGGIYIT